MHYLHVSFKYLLQVEREGEKERTGRYPPSPTTPVQQPSPTTTTPPYRPTEKEKGKSISKEKEKRIAPQRERGGKLPPSGRSA